MGIRWPEAYTPVGAQDEKGDPQSALQYPLLTAQTKDGHWLQFAQVQPRLFRAMMEEFDLFPLLADPKWKNFPMLETAELHSELREFMLNKVRARTLAEWQQVFETNHDINAEIFRSGPGVLDHPQLLHDGRVAVVDDPERGPVRRPSPMVHTGGGPLSPPRPAPRLDEHGEQVRAEGSAGEDPVAATPEAPGGAGLPLEGVTVLDLGLMFAGPFGATILSDLGARVLKIENLEGDQIRKLVAFPEAAGARVMQGKESIALDIGTDDGKRILRELVGRCDVVLQAFRAGAAERAGFDADTLRALNPDLVYVNAPGYGTDGPFGDRPAYAPSIGAATGLALTDVPDAASATGSMREIKSAATRLFAAAAVPSLQADGIAALGVASTLLLGLVARARRRPLGPLTVTMLGTAANALADQVVDYAGRPAAPLVDPGGHGFCALYRMYQAAEGWVFLAAPADREWAPLVAALGAETELAGERFATPRARRENDGALAEALGKIFAIRPAAEWEGLLTKADVGCVQVTEAPPETRMQTVPELVDEYTATATSPVFDEHLRVAPPVRFSRSRTQAKGGCLCGEHTDAVLRELGYGDKEIADLRERKVIG
ncbi:CoA transferase [Actinomadura sp. SCN-SB]|uniref:CaiB/BaiF CoA-transferase family protein n=1 Tax=Actinomadura sp. SCN-SB TaxID=3373092 RepID=UPI0037514466